MKSQIAGGHNFWVLIHKTTERSRFSCTGDRQHPYKVLFYADDGVVIFMMSRVLSADGSCRLNVTDVKIKLCVTTHIIHPD